MKIKNVSAKIIHIGKIMIAPDEEVSVAQKLANEASVQTLIGMGFLAACEETKETTKAKAEKAVKEAPAAK